MRMDQIFSKLQKLWQNRWRGDGIRVEHLPRIQYVAAQRPSQKSFLFRLGETPENFTRRIFLCRCSTTFLVKQMTKNNVWQMLDSLSLFARRFGKGQWSFIGPVSAKTIHKELGDKIAERMLLEVAESTCPIFRATTPLSRCNLKSKGHGKLSIHFTADYPTVETMFRIIVFCQSAQSLRSSCKHVWRIWEPSR